MKALCLSFAATLLILAPDLFGEGKARNVEHINEYYQRMDNYRRSGRCETLDLAKNRALMQLNDEGDPSLANDWNRYASRCGLTPIVTSDSSLEKNKTTAAAAPKQSESSCPYVYEMEMAKRGEPISRLCPDGSYIFMVISP